MRHLRPVMNCWRSRKGCRMCICSAGIWISRCVWHVCKLESKLHFHRFWSFFFSSSNEICWLVVAGCRVAASARLCIWNKRIKARARESEVIKNDCWIISTCSSSRSSGLPLCAFNCFFSEPLSIFLFEQIFNLIHLTWRLTHSFTMLDIHIEDMWWWRRQSDIIKLKRHRKSDYRRDKDVTLKTGERRSEGKKKLKLCRGKMRHETSTRFLSSFN